jgi:hypothetical protein
MDENGPFIDGLPNLKMVDLSMAMLVITRWYPQMDGFLPEHAFDETVKTWGNTYTYHGFYMG